MLPKSFLCGPGQAAAVSLHSHSESAEQQQLCIAGCSGCVSGWMWPGEVLLWGTELRNAGRERLKALHKLKNWGQLQAGGGKPEKYSGEKKGFDWKSLVSLRESKSLKL